jgi:hypothetical protein
MLDADFGVKRTRQLRRRKRDEPVKRELHSLLNRPERRKMYEPIARYQDGVRQSVNRDGDDGDIARRREPPGETASAREKESGEREKRKIYECEQPRSAEVRRYYNVNRIKPHLFPSSVCCSPAKAHCPAGGIPSNESRRVVSLDNDTANPMRT